MSGTLWNIPVQKPWPVTPQQKSIPGSLQPAASEVLCRQQSLGEGTHRPSLKPASLQTGSQVFSSGTLYLKYGSFTNIIDLQVGRTSSHGKAVTPFSGLHYKFPRVPPLPLAGVRRAPAPRATLLLLDYAAGPISYKRCCSRS